MHIFADVTTAPEISNSSVTDSTSLETCTRFNPCLNGGRCSLSMANQWEVYKLGKQYLFENVWQNAIMFTAGSWFLSILNNLFCLSFCDS